jgi:hypothetical protein
LRALTAARDVDVLGQLGSSLQGWRMPSTAKNRCPCQRKGLPCSRSTSAPNMASSAAKSCGLSLQRALQKAAAETDPLDAKAMPERSASSQNASSIWP